MPKFLIASLAVVAAGSATVSAAENSAMRSNAGVGLGTLLFEAMDADGLLSQTAAGSTNVLFFYNQAFFISSGTGGASKPDEFVQNRENREFLRDNLDAVARDMATGSGESLTTLAELNGIPEADRAAFYARLQAHYAEIFTSSDVTSDEVLANIGKTLS